MRWCPIVSTFLSYWSLTTVLIQDLGLARLELKRAQERANAADETQSADFRGGWPMALLEQVTRRAVILKHVFQNYEETNSSIQHQYVESSSCLILRPSDRSSVQLRTLLYNFATQVRISSLLGVT